MKNSRRFICIVGVALLLAVMGCQTEDTSPGALVQKGNNLFFKGDYRQAEQAYRQAIDTEPSLVSAWMGLAETRLKLGDVKEATDAYARLLEIDPGHVPARLNMARFDLLSNRLEAAEQGVQQVLSVEPANIDALFLFAEICEKEGRFKQAEQLYGRVLSVQRDNTAALLRLGAIFAKTGDTVQARAHLEQAVAVDPSAIDPRLVLFNFHMSRKDYSAAEKALAEAVAAHPENPDLHILLGNFYFSRKQPDQAEQAFLKAVETGGDHLPARLAAANFYRAVGRPDKALEMYRSALAVNPRSLRARHALAGFYLENNLLDAAAKEVETILQANDTYLPARLLKIRLLIVRQEYDRAISLCDAYLTENPTSSDLYYAKGLAFWHKEDLVSAEKAVSRAIALSPGNISARLRLADIYLKMGETEKAQAVNRELLAFLQEHLNLEVVPAGAVDPERTRPRGLDSFGSLLDIADAHPFGDAERLSGLMERYEQTIEGFEAALRKNPLQAGLFENIVFLKGVKGEYDKAIDRCNQRVASLEQMADIAPEQRQSLMAAVYALKGDLYLAKGDREKAKTAFQQAVSMDPDTLKSYFALARLHILEKDLDGAISQYRTILNRHPQQAGPHMLLGVLYKMKEAPEQAEYHYRAALDEDPELAQAANNLAYLLSENPDRLDEALDFALRARSQAPEDPYIMDTLGWIYYRMERYDKALEHLQAAADRIPDNVTVNYHLGMTYYRQGQFEQARIFLDRALSLNGKFYGADEARTLLDELM
ncbi:tetratricopeptide repeat protein [Desulfosudis oleivorans]|uniref:Tetratricopeptide TPR_2 repeat protein n=1 Tax=Desulfosudis oleivorans (strain DSM 6200 / JCM 39069 / Hxd3) TaxID=96561 RepID=A8ZZY6_DESOH|nr:tetratricopeptide repeat protein [Desulfosudis oleivorans]ABW67386.1 Tetratricopeptide TPR_2 repeat protein [Desulfosudis oleivorans Hxd3]